MHSVLITFLIFTVTCLSQVSAFSAGIGACGAGLSAIESDEAGNPHINGAQGTLFEGATTLMINGSPANPDAITPIPLGADVFWEVVASQIAYKGIFVRVEKVSDDFTIQDYDTAVLQSAASCDAVPGVVGVSHTSSAQKIKSSGTIYFSSTGTATLDVSVVFDLSLHAWSSFPLSIETNVSVAPFNAPTPNPTDSPDDPRGFLQQILGFFARILDFLNPFN
jgi:hypothetical protein